MMESTAAGVVQHTKSTWDDAIIVDDEEVDEAAHNVDDDADEAHHNGDENEHKHPLLRALQRFPGRQIVQTSQELRMLCVRVT